MKTHVSVVPSDHLNIVDGNVLQVPFPTPANLHALRDLPQQPGFPRLGGGDDMECPSPEPPIVPAKRAATHL